MGTRIHQALYFKTFNKAASTKAERTNKQIRLHPLEAKTNELARFIDPSAFVTLPEARECFRCRSGSGSATCACLELSLKAERWYRLSHAHDGPAPPRRLHTTIPDQPRTPMRGLHAVLSVAPRRAEQPRRPVGDRRTELEKRPAILLYSLWRF